MSKSELGPDCPCARLCQRTAFNILFDECAIAALSDAVAMLRRANDSAAPDLEHAIRIHRIAILKQRAIFGAAGIDV